jgi:hypothetical protein
VTAPQPAKATCGCVTQLSVRGPITKANAEFILSRVQVDRRACAAPELVAALRALVGANNQHLTASTLDLHGLIPRLLRLQEAINKAEDLLARLDGEGK